MFGRPAYYFQDSLDQTYAFSVWPLSDGNNREEAVIPCKTYAKQTLDSIARGFGDPLHYGLLDLWLEVYQRPWARPRNLHQLIDELADKIASGELKVYLEDSPVWKRHDSGAVGEGGGAGSGGDSGGAADIVRTGGGSGGSAQGSSETSAAIAGSAGAAAMVPKAHLPQPPQSMDEVLTRMDQATENVQQARQTGAPLPTSPFSTEDKLDIVEQGLEEKYIVRVIRTKHAADTGSIGWVNPTTQTSTYWTTTYTQLEYADKDAELIAKAVGTHYDPKDQYTLLAIDTDKAAEVGDMETFIPTYARMGEFAQQELPNRTKTTADAIAQVMTPEYSREYERLVHASNEMHYDLNDEEQLTKFASEIGLSPEERKLLKTRQAINEELGANEMFLGNGLTKDANAPEGELRYGLVETFTYDKKPMPLGELESQGVLKRIPLNSH